MTKKPRSLTVPGSKIKVQSKKKKKSVQRGEIRCLKKQEMKESLTSSDKNLLRCGSEREAQRSFQPGPCRHAGGLTGSGSDRSR